MFSFPKGVFLDNPNASLNSSSYTASFLSILFPNITMGTFFNSGVANKPSNSY
jgi:hypothetical protein